MNRKICFVALESLPLLTLDENLKKVGGSELMQVLIGKELAKRGFQICFITYDENSKKENVNNIKIVKTVPRYNNFSFLKNILLFWKSLKKADADIYFQGTGSAGIIPLFCIIHGRKYIKWIVSDSNLLFKRIHGNHPILLKISLYLDIKFAHRILVQNLFQKELIEKKFNKKCNLIKNPVVIPDNLEFNENKKNYILWVGTVRPVKQPEIFLKIAKSLPKLNFVMIGGESERHKKLYIEIEKETKTISNLKFLGFVPFNNFHKYYQEASILINTSKIEGFPNTFLESWINGTPVISLNVDPDELICNKKLGFHSKTLEQLIFDINNLFFDINLRREMGVNAKKYVEQNHDLKKIITQFEKLILSFKK